MNDKPRFKMIDEEFECEICKKSVKPLGYTARDHCPYCLYSKHVDNNPGDRLNNCQGSLKPVGVELGKKDSLKIIYKCSKCKIIKKNKMAKDDNLDLIIKIMSDV